MRRMGVKQADPEIALERIQLAQQRANGRGIGGKRSGRGGKFFRRRNGAAVIRAQIEAVISRVLRNQVQLLHAVGNQRLGLGHDVRLLPAAMRTAHPGNDAKAARMIAALGDFDVGEVPGREAEPRRGEIGDEGGTLGHVQQCESMAECRGSMVAQQRFWFFRIFRAAKRFGFFVLGDGAVLLQFSQPPGDFSLRC